jgi:DNA repair exonuclease SbcCD ATPase subunit
MILINSANFQFADIDLSKEVFFVGDNASGKTTTTRAIHFLYNANGDKLGIPRTKSTFAKHYFPHDDSYIIYVFESFFIFTFKKNNTIRRWLSKQEFDINEIIKNEKLLNFEVIQEYIKQAPLKVKPKSIEEYTDIIYGKNKQYLDFCVAKIENYKVFLEVFDMVFNVDKSIVTAVDIKKAIQKSLSRDDEVLSLDYDDFIKKLNEFSRAYNFFKTFDSNRENLINAVSFKNGLLELEDKITAIIKAIAYRQIVESKEFAHLDSEKKKLTDANETYRKKANKIEGAFKSCEKRIKNKTNRLDKEIMRLEDLKEKFVSFEVEKNIEIAGEFESIEKELDHNKFLKKQLEEKLTSAKKIIENKIEQLQHNIKTIIPNEMDKKIYALEGLEKQSYEEDKLDIENEYNTLERQLLNEINELEEKIQTIKSEVEKFENTQTSKIKELKHNSENQIKILHENLKLEQDKIYELENKRRGLKTDKDVKDSELRNHEDKYAQLRSNNAKILWGVRKKLNEKIASARDVLHPKPNSFKEFLSNEIEDWEKHIYPILDKSLLLKSCDELKPVKLDTTKTISFSVDASKLEKIPTKDEALEIIKNAKYKKSQELKNAKSVYQDEKAKLDETKNMIVAEKESLQKQIDNTSQSIGTITTDIKRLEDEISENETSLEKDIIAVKSMYETKINARLTSKKELESKVDEKRSKTLKELKRKRVDTIAKRAKDRDDNISIIKTNVEKEKALAIKEVEDEIAQMKSSNLDTQEDRSLDDLSSKIAILQEKRDKAYDAQKYLDDYREKKEDILKLPAFNRQRDDLENFLQTREKTISNILSYIKQKIEDIKEGTEKLNEKTDKYEKGLKKYKQHNFEEIEKPIQSNEYLIDLIVKYEDFEREYQNDKSKFRTMIDKLKRIEKHSLIEINLSNENFDTVKSIKELENILESLSELENFEKNKYDSEKKRRHNNFDSFLRATIPSKLKSFDDLELDFEKAKNSINKNLSNADFGVIRDIKLVTDVSQTRNDTIASLMKQLSKKAADTVGLYSQKSLFYYDISKSVDNINEIGRILEQMKQKSSKGVVNLFDTIDLSISYTENGKKIERKESIKDDSSSGGNILLKVAIAISILTRYTRKVNYDTPFFLIIDEISKLQSKNQDLLKNYINKNGFKTLFITPDPAYPDPDRAIYYTFKNIQQEGENLEIRQMNIV